MPQVGTGSAVRLAEDIVRAIQKEHGYTLIDRLFVCALIGVLSVIALPNLLLAKQAAGSASAITRFFATNANGQLYEHTATLYAAMPQQGTPALGHVLH